MQLPTHCVAEPPQQPRNRQQLPCEQMSEGPRTLARGSSAQGRSAGWRLRRAGACRRVQEGSWPGPWACRWARAATGGHQSGRHRFSATPRGSVPAGPSLGEAPPGHLPSSTLCARGGCRAGRPVTPPAARPPCSGRLGSCGPAVLFLSHIPGLRRGSHKPSRARVPSASSRPPRRF